MDRAKMSSKSFTELAVAPPTSQRADAFRRIIMSTLNWASARIVPPSKPSARQLWFQGRYGDELTKAIKVAKHNHRRRFHELAQGLHPSS